MELPDDIILYILEFLPRSRSDWRKGCFFNRITPLLPLLLKELQYRHLYERVRLVLLQLEWNIFLST